MKTPRDKAREARNDVYRQHILEAAEQVFAERGFEAAKVQEISAKAGLSMGTIYSIFPGKADLFDALLEMRGRELLAVAREATKRSDPPLDALRALGDSYVAWFVDHPAFLRMQLGASVSWALGPSSAPSRMAFWREIHDLQADIFRRGAKSGAFVDEDPAFLAKLFSAIDEVVLADWVATGMNADRATLTARLDRLVDRTFAAARPTRGR